MDAPNETRWVAGRLRNRMSLPEVLLWRAIKGRRLAGLKFRRQHPLGPYVLDFFCAEHGLCVEVDGASHGVGNRPQRDGERDAWLTAKGVRTLRLPATVVLNEVDDAARTILAFVFPDRDGVSGDDPLRPFGPPPREGEELRAPDAPPPGELSRSD